MRPQANQLAKELRDNTQDFTAQGRVVKELEQGELYILECKPPHLNRANGRNVMNIKTLARLYDGYSMNQLEYMVSTGEFPLGIVSYYSKDSSQVQLMSATDLMLEDLITIEELGDIIKQDLQNLEREGVL